MSNKNFLFYCVLGLSLFFSAIPILAMGTEAYTGLIDIQKHYVPMIAMSISAFLIASTLIKAKRSVLFYFGSLLSTYLISIHWILCNILIDNYAIWKNMQLLSKSVEDINAIGVIHSSSFIFTALSAFVLTIWYFSSNLGDIVFRLDLTKETKGKTNKNLESTKVSVIEKSKKAKYFIEPILASLFIAVITQVRFTPENLIFTSKTILYVIAACVFMFFLLYFSNTKTQILKAFELSDEVERSRHLKEYERDSIHFTNVLKIFSEIGFILSLSLLLNWAVINFRLGNYNLITNIGFAQNNVKHYDSFFDPVFIVMCVVVSLISVAILNAQIDKVNTLKELISERFILKTLESKRAEDNLLREEDNRKVRESLDNLKESTDAVINSMNNFNRNKEFKIPLQVRKNALKKKKNNQSLVSVARNKRERLRDKIQKDKMKLVSQYLW
jgi:hypothetical protein